jgi:hypothetical protein
LKALKRIQGIGIEVAVLRQFFKRGKPLKRKPSSYIKSNKRGGNGFIIPEILKTM